MILPLPEWWCALLRETRSIVLSGLLSSEVSPQYLAATRNLAGRLAALEERVANLEVRVDEPGEQIQSHAEWINLLKESHEGVLAAFLLLLLISSIAQPAQLKQQTVDEWNRYILATQAQIDKRVSGQTPFLWLDSMPDGSSRARSGEIIVAPFGEHTPKHVSGGLIHHWIGAAYIPGAKMKDVLIVVRDYSQYKDSYAPTVIASALTTETPPAIGEADRFVLRFRNQSVVSKVALDATYTATYVQLDPKRTYAVAHTTQVQEIDHFGEASQRILPPGEGNGYIWLLYATTRFVEQDGGVYIEAEGIALSRDIPVAARWFVDPIVRRVSRDALHTSLTQTVQAVSKYLASGKGL